MIYPCIDLMDGMVVQLVQGRRENKKIGTKDFETQIKKFKPFGTIQLIYLNATMDEGNNYNLIKEIIKKIKCRVGGGIRTVEKAQEVINLGAEKIIVGSSVFKNGKIDSEFLKKLNQKIKKDKIIIAIDTIKEEIVIKGWKQKTGINVFDAVKELEPYCSEFLATYVDKEGMLQGTNIEFFKKLKALTKNDITAAGGITTLDEVRALENADINSALGMAIYTGKIQLDDLLKVIL
jgi:phosphoribosylformimino-5-aminoimidazole carboxamide ribotide isomerase